MERPGYLRIADELRTRVRTGVQPPGSRLPTLRALSAEFAVSLATVRHAVAVLRIEGLVETRTKAGTRVRVRPPVHRLSAERYQDQPRSSDAPDTRTGNRSTPFTIDQNIAWSDYRLDTRFEQLRADAELAALFETDLGEPLLARSFVFYDAGLPSQLSTSYLRWGDVAGTAVADPANEPWPGGTRAQLAALGIATARITESFTAAMPTPAEAAALALPPGTPVLRCTRRHVGPTGRVAEVAHPIVRSAESTIVDFTFAL